MAGKLGDGRVEGVICGVAAKAGDGMLESIRYGAE